MRHSDVVLVRVSISRIDGAVERRPAFAKAEVSIGRNPANDIVLPSARVSSSHARLLVTGRSLTLLDLDSTNGTFIAQERVVGPRVVAEHDEVVIGDFKLGFSLAEDEMTEFAMQPAEPGPSEPHPTAIGPDGWPSPPPPMLDEFEADAPSAPSSAPLRKLERVPMRGSTPPPEPPIATAVEASAFEFEPGSPAALVERVFEAVWSRIVADVVGGTPGLHKKVDRLLAEALRAAARVAPLRPDLHAQMLREMTSEAAIAPLLVGEPDDVLIHGPTDVRINRGGHITRGPSPFSCGAAIVALVSRLTRSDFGRPSTGGRTIARGSFEQYAFEAIAEADAGGTPILSLRRTTLRDAITFDALVGRGVLSRPMAALLATGVVAGHSILVCSGPGADARPVIAALFGAAPSNELGVVLSHQGAPAGLYRPGTIVLTRTSQSTELLDAAIGLGPDRLAIEDVRPGEARAVAGIVSRSLRLVLGMRAPTAELGLARLHDTLSTTLPSAVIGRLLFGAIDLVVVVQAYADGVSRITQIAESTLVDDAMKPSELFSLAAGTRTWTSSGQPSRTLEDAMQRGFPIDPSLADLCVTAGAA